MANPPGYLSTHEVSARFGVRPSTAWQWVRRGHLPGEVFEKRMWIPVWAVERFTPPKTHAKRWQVDHHDPAVDWLMQYQWDHELSDRAMAAKLGMSRPHWNSLRHKAHRLLLKRAQVRARFPEAFAHEVSSPA